MKTRILGRILIAASLAIGAAAAATPNDADIAKGVRHEVLMYSHFTMWDDVNFRVNSGNVELFGAVSQPFKKDDIRRLVQSIPGVASVTNEIKVLPLSPFDDRLRLQVARAIYRDSVLSKYAMDPAHPIRIIVANGHVTLYGAVDSAMDKNVAGIRAGQVFGAFSVDNKLVVDKS